VTRDERWVTNGGIGLDGRELIRLNSAGDFVLRQGGTYTFCPTNAAHKAAGLSISGTVKVEERATEPKTWSLVPITR